MKGIGDVVFAAMEHFDRFNHRLLHGTITHGPGHGHATPTANCHTPARG